MIGKEPHSVIESTLLDARGHDVWRGGGVK